MIYADPNLIRQVIINLIKNAVQAITSATGKIHLRAYSTAEEHVLIYISNDGMIIPEAEAEEIFVPFFTTKKEGSGIGLSLSRQIMKLSGGSTVCFAPVRTGGILRLFLNLNKRRAICSFLEAVMFFRAVSVFY